MAEHQLPKLTVRVRFPSSAPTQRPRSDAGSGRWAFELSGLGLTGVPLASGPGLVALAVILALLVLDVLIYRVRYRLVRAARLMLVDHGPRGRQ
jgi:hypothetical protein